MKRLKFVIIFAVITTLFVSTVILAISYYDQLQLQNGVSKVAAAYCVENGLFANLPNSILFNEHPPLPNGTAIAVGLHRVAYFAYPINSSVFGVDEIYFVPYYYSNSSLLGHVPQGNLTIVYNLFCRGTTPVSGNFT
jgi:hypothetical protein